MHEHDVRDVEGRFGRLMVSIVTGTVLALLLAELVPGLKRIQGGPSDLAIPVLVGAGVCGIAMAVYALLGVLARTRRVEPTPLPRATLRRTGR